MRAPGAPLAQISTLNPVGTLILSSGIFSTGVTVSAGACGASTELAIESGRPCCQPGAAGGGAATGAGPGAGVGASETDAHAATTSKAADEENRRASVLGHAADFVGL